MASSELNPLFQQMGEVLTSIRALQETMEIRQTQAEQLHDLMRADLATLRRDQRDIEEKLECVICVMQHDLEALRSGAADNARSVVDLVSAVQALRRPIAEIVALRARVAGLLFGIAVIGSSALWLAEPVYRWIIETVLSHK